jgi:hypothetical protein
VKHALPTGRAGRLTALGLTLAVPAAIWLSVVAPLVQWHGDRVGALQQRQALSQRMLTLVAALPALRQQAAAITASTTGEPSLLEGESDSVASAFLQERLQAIFTQVGVQLNSIEALSGEDVAAYRRIRLQVAFNASWTVLMGVLKDIQLAAPVLLVDELHVQPALHRIGTAPGTFDVSCDVFSFRSKALKVAAR